MAGKTRLLNTLKHLSNTIIAQKRQKKETLSKFLKKKKVIESKDLLKQENEDDHYKDILQDFPISSVSQLKIYPKSLSKTEFYGSYLL